MVGVISYQSIRKGNGTAVWLDSDGVEREVSSVHKTVEDAEKNFKWPDALVVSETLTRFVRPGRPDRDNDAL